MKKLIIAIVICAVPSLAGATYLAIPPLKPKPAQPIATQMTCLEQVEGDCRRTHRTRLFTRACVRMNMYRCR